MLEINTGRSRKSQYNTHAQAIQQVRDNSQSPNLRGTDRQRERTIRTQSMPLVPSVMQIFGATVPTTGATQDQHPKNSSPHRRASPPGPLNSQAQRLLPTPPNPLPHHQSDDTVVVAPIAKKQHQSPSPTTLLGTSHPQPKNDLPSRQFLAKFRAMDANVELTDQLLAEMEGVSGGVDKPGPHPHSSAPSSFGPGDGSRTSPKEDRRQLQAKHSPRNSREFHPSSLHTSQLAPHTPETQASNYHTPLASPSEKALYQAYATSPRAPAPQPLQPLQRQGGHGSPHHHPQPQLASPRGNPLSPRSPDRSLPVQEEPEDDDDQAVQTETEVFHEHQAGSPTPSSDLNPSGLHLSRPAPASPGESSTLFDGTPFASSAEPGATTAASSSEGEGDGGFTPRSPVSSLPDPQAAQVAMQYLQSLTMEGRMGVPGRGGRTDHLGLQGLDAAIFDSQDEVQGIHVQAPCQPPFGQPAQYNRGAGHARSQSYPDDLSSVDDPTMAYIQAYLAITSPRPDAPIPPTPPSQSSIAPSPALGRGMGGGTYDPRHPPAFSPVPVPMHFAGSDGGPVGGAGGVRGSPYPFPYGHVRRNVTYSSAAPSAALESQSQADQAASRAPSAAAPPSQSLDPRAIHASLVRQWKMYAQNHQYNSYGYAPSEVSTLSPSGTPAHPDYEGWAEFHTARLLELAKFGTGGVGLNGAPVDGASQMSSPSHEPIPLPPPPNTVGAKKRVDALRGRSIRGRAVQVNGHSKNGKAPPSGLSRSNTTGSIVTRKPPPRVESTQPRDTSPEPPSSGDETSTAASPSPYALPEPHFAISEEGNWVNGSLPLPFQALNGILPNAIDGEEEDEGEWVDEDALGDDEEDLLDLEYHPTFVGNVEKRRRRWEGKWEGLVAAFQALDRQTDATLLLLASPSHSTKLHALSSRSIRRSPALSHSASMGVMKREFAKVASLRRKQRTTHRRASSLLDRFHLLSPVSSDGAASDGSSSSARESELRRALETALGSLQAMNGIYEEREKRWRDEMGRAMEDRERVEMLLRQVLGPVINGGGFESSAATREGSDDRQSAINVKGKGGD